MVDATTKRVLTLAYMNEESLRISMERGLTCFYSRSRQELWLKGETSGNYQHIVSITADCDGDALTVLVDKDGPACHTGSDSCFNDVVWESDERQEFSLEGLMSLIEGRRTDKKEGSYTTYLFEKGLDKILKKVGEECTEVIIAAKAEDRGHFAGGYPPRACLPPRDRPQGEAGEDDEVNDRGDVQCVHPLVAYAARKTVLIFLFSCGIL